MIHTVKRQEKKQVARYILNKEIRNDASKVYLFFKASSVSQSDFLLSQCG